MTVCAESTCLYKEGKPGSLFFFLHETGLINDDVFLLLCPFYIIISELALLAALTREPLVIPTTNKITLINAVVRNRPKNKKKFHQIPIKYILISNKPLWLSL